MIRLGSGEAARAGAAPKAALLDRAARAGLPVPAGFVVLDGEPARAAGGGLWAVRSAFGAEDGKEQSLAGWFETKLNVPGPGVPAAAEAVRASGARRPGRFRRDVLVMRMAEARHAGVAFTERDFEDDLVNHVPGLAAGLVSGAEPGGRMLLARRERFEPLDAPPGWPRRLQALLRDVRRVFGAGDWDVEWADDGRRCWLLQVRPVTAPPRRDEAFTLANHKEILPDLPSALMTSVILEAAPELFAYYRQFDAGLPARRLFIEEFAGRPLINISLMADMMRRWGLPTALVTGNIGGAADRPAGLNPWRLLRRLPVLARVALAQLRAPAGAGRTALRLRARPEARTFSEAAAQLREAYTELVRGMFALTGAMSGPLALLRAAGTLSAWQARHETVTTRMARELRSLPRAQWLASYGHRGVYESDVARPRFAEEPPPAVAAECEPQRARPRLGWKALLTAPLWRQAARPLAARERFRHEMMREFARLRRRLLELAAAAGIEEQTLWLLTAREAARLDEGWRPDETFLAARRLERARLARIRLPDLVRRSDDLAQFDGCGPAGRSGVLRGLSLTEGRGRGRALVLAAPAAELPPGYVPGETVLVAPAVDAGWMPLFHQVAGVAVETGGDLSHGSILLRELGIPSVTNVAGLMRSVAPGEEIELDAAAGMVRRAAGDGLNLPPGRTIREGDGLAVSESRASARAAD